MPIKTVTYNTKTHKLVPIERSVNSAMKAECIGEFSFNIEVPEFDEETEEFTGETVAREVTVPWDVCKRIYKAMLNAVPDYEGLTVSESLEVLSREGQGEE